MKRFPTNIALVIGFVIINILFKGIIWLIYEFIYAHRIYSFHISTLVIVVICFIADDFTYYWFHRLSHQIRFLWASHVVHHSSEEYSLLTAGLRHTWTGNFSGTFLFWVWMPFVGFNPAMVLIIKSVSIIYQFWIHTETINKMPAWFETLFNTPSHHRVHHGSDLIYLDKNYAGTLIIWDKIFKTYQPEKFTPQYGLTKKLNTANPFVIAFHEWISMFKDLKKSKGISECLHHVFNAPGWSKNGETKTTKQLRTETERKKIKKQLEMHRYINAFSEQY
jgi:sterol desaturase/sphingolipid hydroxylase (fatty acid hydroxylase superfamily)